MATDDLRFGFCGFGEAASTFAKDLRTKWPDMTLIAYDKHVNDTVRNRAKESNSVLVPSPSALAEQAELIFSLVTAGTALEAAREFSGLLTSEQIYVDFNSVSPKLKTKIGKTFQEKAVSMVDAAVMGAIPGNGLGVSILFSGEKAPSVSESMNKAGFNTEVVGSKIGDAAAIKMVRSVFTKGLEALFIEMLLAAKRYEVEEQVIASVSHSLENQRLRDVMNRLVVSQALHSERKKSEMDNVIETLRDAGLEPTMSRATRAVFAWVTSRDLITCLGSDELDYHRVIAALEDTTSSSS